MRANARAIYRNYVDNFTMKGTTLTIETTRLEHPAVKDYLTNADRRILTGARFVLEALCIPCPTYLNRKPAGRPLAKEVMAEFRRDNPESFHQRTMRKANGG